MTEYLKPCDEIWYLTFTSFTSIWMNAMHRLNFQFQGILSFIFWPCPYEIRFCECFLGAVCHPRRGLMVTAQWAEWIGAAQYRSVCHYEGWKTSWLLTEFTSSERERELLQASRLWKGGRFQGKIYATRQRWIICTPGPLLVDVSSVEFVAHCSFVSCKTWYTLLWS